MSSSPHSDNDISLEEVDIGDEETLATLRPAAHDFSLSPTARESGRRRRSLTTSHRTIGPALLTPHDRRESIPMRWHTIGGARPSFLGEDMRSQDDSIDEMRLPSRESAVDQMRIVRDGLSDVLGSSGMGSWLPIRQVSEQPGSVSRQKPYTGRAIANADEDTLSLMPHIGSVRSGSTRAQQSNRDNLSINVNVGHLGDDLTVIETGTVYSSDSPSSPSQLSADDARSMARSLSSIVRRVVSNDRRPSREGRPSADMDTISLATDDNYAYSPVESLHPSVTLDPEIENTFLPGPITEGLPPLGGKSLAFLSGNNRYRVLLYQILSHQAFDIFAFVLILIQTLVLTYRAVRALDSDNSSWGHRWPDYALLIVFCCYTMEVIIRIIVSGLILNPTTDTQQFVFEVLKMLHLSRDDKRDLIMIDGDRFLTPQHTSGYSITKGSSVVKTVRAEKEPMLNESGPIRTARLAYLRSSWNRLDFSCVVFYWIYLIVVTSSSDNKSTAVNVFRALSALRILKWMKLTNGTSTVLDSIKTAVPALANVMTFISVFWTLFALVGIQAFSGSFRRQCVWVDPYQQEANYTNDLQFCGGYLDPVNKTHLPWVRANGEPGTDAAKGFICPAYSMCVELDENVYNNTVSFDNILQSLEMVFVVMGMNGFSDLMNYTADSDHLIAALFFVAGVVILAWWMFNLFIAVISTSFAVTREMKERRVSTKGQKPEKIDYRGPDTKLKLIYTNIEPVFVLLIFIDFIIECCKSSTMSERRSNIIYLSQVITSTVLLMEILFRFAASFPYWREFFLLPQNAKNYIDLLLVVITCVILIPPIKDSRIAYPWLSFFQVARIYRVVVATKFTRQNWLIVMGKVRNLADLVVFLLLMLYICSLVASELLRGNIPQEYQGQAVTISFYNMANSFAGIYQIMTTEGWANVLYTITGSLSGTSLAWVGAIFICGWFLFANSVVVNLFIAAIQENFDFSEEEKRLRQIVAYSDNYKPTELGDGPTSMFESMAGDRRRRKSSSIPMQYAAREMLGSGDVVADFLLPESIMMPTVDEESIVSKRTIFSFDYWKEKFTSDRHSNPFYFQPSFRFDEMKDVNKFVKKVLLIKIAHKKVREKYVQDHPNFNRVLFCLSPESRLRRFCQTIVGPTHGTRYNGANRNYKLSRIFSAIIMICVIGLVIIACVTTPFFQKYYYQLRGCDSADNGCGAWSWMTYTDISFAAIFTLEAAIKVIADGFIYTPNAYLWSTWNGIDFFVLVTLWIDILTTFLNRGTNARFLRAFKAFRALRLLHVNDAAKETFHNIIIVGLGKIVGAAIVSLTLLLPFSLWGLNIFMGKFDSCTDSNVNELSTCTGEFLNSVYNWNFWLPRSYNNPGYSFDQFSQSISILFQIISLEGWNNVLQSAEDVVGVGLNQRTNNSVYNGIFVYLFNFISIAFIATLFITVIMQNYAMKTGVGFLTSKQRAFLEIQKILEQVRPSRTGQRPKNRFRRYCYNRTVARGGSWNKYVTVILLFQVVILCSEYYPSLVSLDRVRDLLYLVTSALLVLYVICRLVGLPWSSYRLHYKRNAWDIFWFAIVLASFTLSLATIKVEDDAKSGTVGTVKRLLFVAVTLMLIPKSDRLSRLFVSASASLPAILSLLFTWFVLFLVYAIAFNQIFGLTRIGPNGSSNVNFRTIPKAMLLLFRMSCGEGWNSVMLDYTIQSPYCIDSSDFFSSDCGSVPYAYVLFFSWNIISMYIFANMFISLIYESFSYVYQECYVSESNGSAQFGQFVSRGTIRAYKDAWDRIDENGTGYIPKSKVGKLLRSLPHPLDVHIYESPYTYQEILERCKISARRHNHGRLVGDNDIDAIPEVLRNIDTDKVKEARRRYTRMYEEIMMQEVVDHGIPFSAPLNIIPYYKIENADNDAVTLDQYILRRSHLKAVDAQIKRKSVQNFCRMISARTRFLGLRNGFLRRQPSATVPTIVIEPDRNENYSDDEST